MINKAFWEKNKYAMFAQHVEEGDIQAVTFPNAISFEDDLARAAYILGQMGISEIDCKEEDYELMFGEVLSNVKLFDLLKQAGASEDTVTVIEHWAYFEGLNEICMFTKEICAEGYEVLEFATSRDEQRLCVKFAHEETVSVKTICPRTVWLKRLAHSLKGAYDGWEVTMNLEDGLVPASKLRKQM